MAPLRHCSSDMDPAQHGRSGSGSRSKKYLNGGVKRKKKNPAPNRMWQIQIFFFRWLSFKNIFFRWLSNFFSFFILISYIGSRFALWEASGIRIQLEDNADPDPNEGQCGSRIWIGIIMNTGQQHCFIRNKSFGHKVLFFINFTFKGSDFRFLGSGPSLLNLVIEWPGDG